MDDPKRRNAGEEYLHEWERQTWPLAHPDREWHEVTRDKDGTLVVRRVPSLDEQVREAFIAGYKAGTLNPGAYWGEGMPGQDVGAAYERWKQGRDG